MIKAWVLVLVSTMTSSPTTVETMEFNTYEQCIHVGKEAAKMVKYDIRGKCINTSGKFESVDIPRSSGD